MSQQKSSEKISLFQERLEARMRRLGIQSNELAEKIGVEKSSISNWLNGLNKAKGENLRKLAQVLDVSIPWLTGQEEEESKTILHEPRSGFTTGREELLQELELWKRRAKESEKQLADIRKTLRSLSEASPTSTEHESPTEKPSSSLPTDIGERVLRAEPSTRKKGDRHQHS